MSCTDEWDMSDYYPAEKTPKTKKIFFIVAAVATKLVFIILVYFKLNKNKNKNK